MNCEMIRHYLGAFGVGYICECHSFSYEARGRRRWWWALISRSSSCSSLISLTLRCPTGLSTSWPPPPSFFFPPQSLRLVARLTYLAIDPYFLRALLRLSAAWKTPKKKIDVGAHLSGWIHKLDSFPWKTWMKTEVSKRNKVLFGFLDWKWPTSLFPFRLSFERV